MDQINGLVLDTAGPLDDGMRSFNKLYFIFGLIGFIIGAIIEGFKTGIGLAIVGLIVAFFIKALIAQVKIENLSRTKFHYPTSNISSAFLMKTIVKPLTSLGMTVEMNSDGSPIILHNGLHYTILIFGKSTFTIDCQIPLTQRIGHYSKVSLYKKAVVTMGLIAYTIQHECIKQRAV